MATGNDLFLLVSRLTKTEKRYFTQKTRFQKKEALYKKLFDLLNELREYNRKEILDRLGGGINTAILLERERYLYDRIMASLKEYCAKEHVIIQINDLFFESKILYDKGLYEVALKKLDKAAILANKYHQSVILLEILPFRAKVITEVEKKELTEKIELIDQKVRDKLLAVEQETTCRYLNTMFLMLSRTLPKGNGTQLTIVSAILEKKYQKAIKKYANNLSSFYAQYYYYSMQAVYAVLHKEYIKASQQQEQVVKLWSNHPEMIAKNMQSYVTQLANYIAYLGHCEKYDEVLEQIKVMEGLKASTKDVEGELFQNIYFYKQQIYLSTKEYVKAKALIPEIEKGLKIHANKLNPARKLAFYYNTAVTLWLNDDYSLANQWLLKIRNTDARSSDIRTDIRRFASWIQLAIFYELNSDVPLLDLSNKLRAVNRGKIQTPLNSFEEIVLKYFKQLIDIVREQRKIRPIFTAFLGELNQLPEQEKKVLGYQEYCIWVGRKVDFLGKI